MKWFLSFFFVFVFSTTTIQAQSQFIDSIIALRTLDSLPGKVNLYYAPDTKNTAQQYQTVLENATKFYEKRYGTRFNYRVAVLDSSHWITEKYPFGFLAYDSGWLFLPAKVSGEFFMGRSGLSNHIINLFLKQHRLTALELANTVYFVNALHELGHYFVIDNKHSTIPDMFANEFIATYFSYCYFKSVHYSGLQNFIDFASLLSRNYEPKFRNIADLDSLYTEMPVQNFRWFHSNIALLCEQVYKVCGISFIDYYLQAFRGNLANHFTTQQVVDILDKKTHGLVRQWADKMLEEKSKRTVK